MQVSVKIQGAKALSNAIKTLPANAQRNVMRRVPQGGAREIGMAVRRAAPRGFTGKLRKAIKWRRLNPRGTGGRFISIVYVDYKIAPHFHLVEKGTKHRETRRGRSTGKVKGTHFAEEAIRSRRNGAVEAMVLTGRDGLRKEILKTFRRSAGIRRGRRR